MADRWWDDVEYAEVFRRVPGKPLGWPLRQEFVALARRRALVAARKRASRGRFEMILVADALRVVREETAAVLADTKPRLAQVKIERQADREAMISAWESLQRVRMGQVDRAHVNGAIHLLDARLIGDRPTDRPTD